MPQDLSPTFPSPHAGLLKLVFATETLAAGINMPARTTLIAALSRRRDNKIGPLQHNELLQMAGRAGRRGFDTAGNCVIIQVRGWRAGADGQALKWGCSFTCACGSIWACN